MTKYQDESTIGRWHNSCSRIDFAGVSHWINLGPVTPGPQWSHETMSPSAQTQSSQHREGRVGIRGLGIREVGFGLE